MSSMTRRSRIHKTVGPQRGQAVLMVMRRYPKKTNGTNLIYAKPDRTFGVGDGSQGLEKAKEKQLESELYMTSLRGWISYVSLLRSGVVGIWGARAWGSTIGLLFLSWRAAVYFKAWHQVRWAVEKFEDGHNLLLEVDDLRAFLYVLHEGGKLELPIMMLTAIVALGPNLHRRCQRRPKAFLVGASPPANDVDNEMKAMVMNFLDEFIRPMAEEPPVGPDGVKASRRLLPLPGDSSRASSERVSALSEPTMDMHVDRMIDRLKKFEDTMITADRAASSRRPLEGASSTTATAASSTCPAIELGGPGGSEGAGVSLEPLRVAPRGPRERLLENPPNISAPPTFALPAGMTSRVAPELLVQTYGKRGGTVEFATEWVRMKELKRSHIGGERVEAAGSARGGAKNYVDHALRGFLQGRKRELSFALPRKCFMIPPVVITQAASGAKLIAFREAMGYDDLVASFSWTKQREEAGAAWMLDPICSDIDDVCVGQWSTPRSPGALSLACLVRAAEPLTVLAGRAAVTARRSAMSEELQQSNDDRAWYLFNAALTLSVPIGMRALPDGDASHVAALIFSETTFASRAASGANSCWGFVEKARRLAGAANSLAKQEPQAKLEAVIKTRGLALIGKALAAASVTALKGLQPFVLDDARGSAFALAEAKECFVFIMNSLRMARLAGDVPKGEKLSVSRVVGLGKKTPAMTHALFKKKELVEYIFHEALLSDKALHRDMAIFQTPLSIAQKFATSGADGLVASHRMSESGGSDGMGALFALKVAEHRDGADPKAKAMIDVARPVWAGAFDDEIAELTLQVGANYRAFVAARAGGPIPAAPDLDQHFGLSGVSELGGEQKEELRKFQEQRKQLRRKTVNFATLPIVGAASGADFATVRMQGARGGLSLGRRFGRKKGDVRAFVASAELSPPNIPILFDGRGRANRRVTGSLEDKSATGGPRALAERWRARAQPTKKEGPRAAARASSYTINNKEMAHFSPPLKGPRKAARRSVFNSRGETLSADATCAGISARRFPELPRMCHDAMASALGVASCAALENEHLRVQGGVDERGHPFSRSEVKPISFWQTSMEHREVTRVVDFAPGSGALAVAASGAVECEGIAGNEARRDWLDPIVGGRAMCEAGREDGRAEQLGGDAEFVEKARKYLGGTTTEARRLSTPVAEGGDEEGEGG
ncbi:unnamed protein product [Prorocentrum cordatum]|uniref:Uncharacterized protein n=1 Tax=Prorocentrum cordatum TaxID=2364126 RepID=A0ABN9RDD3_9DINO|nr:unnamed protein product [Polarella glacialis]